MEEKTEKKGRLALLILGVFLSFISGIFFSQILVHQNLGIIIYLLCYFLIFTYYVKKKHKLTKPDIILAIISLVMLFPCLWVYAGNGGGETLGFSHIMGSVYDLFRTSDFFFQYGHNTGIDGILKSDVKVVYQLYSTILGVVVFNKIEIITTRRNQVLKNLAAYFKNNKYTILTVSTFLVCANYYSGVYAFFEKGGHNRNPESTFYLAVSFLTIYFLALIVYKKVFYGKLNAKLNMFLTLTFIIFFPTITISLNTTNLFTDSMEYNGKYPTITALGNSFYNIGKELLEYDFKKYSTSHFTLYLIIFNFLEFVFALLLVPNLKWKKKQKETGKNGKVKK